MSTNSVIQKTPTFEVHRNAQFLSKDFKVNAITLRANVLCTLDMKKVEPTPPKEEISKPN